MERVTEPKVVASFPLTGEVQGTGSAAEVLAAIGRFERFVITSHARPDGDAVGSLLGCYQLLRALGKQADMVLSDGVPHIYRDLPFANLVTHASGIGGNHEAAIILECDSVKRTRVSGLDDLFLFNVDHHLSARTFANLNWIDSSACATGEMIYKLAIEAAVPITPEMATCIYTAVLTDTGSFCYPSTTASTFALAQQLVRHGADPAKIAQSVYFANPTSKMRLMGAALSTLRREGKLTWMYVTQETMDRCDALEEDCEGIVNYALGVENVEVAAFFRELPDGRFRVSLRSKGAVDVAALAERFGGGGHECASGLAIDGPLSAASERILAQLRLEVLRSQLE